jgi:uncharacterized RDD family membrane protein YckC
MQYSSEFSCPVCGRPTRSKDLCTFCGASRKDPAHFGNEGRPPATADPDSWRNQGVDRLPSEPGPTRPREAPVLAPKFAGFWIRCLAYVIDGFVLLVLLTLLVGVGIFGYATGSETDTVHSFAYSFFERDWGFLNVGAFALNMAYFTFFIGTRGQTPGKMVCGLKVVRLDGTPVGFAQAALRTLGYYLNHFTLCLGFLWVAFDSRKQGLHDKIAGTYEIRLGLAELQDGQSPTFPGPLGSR